MNLTKNQIVKYSIIGAIILGIVIMVVLDINRVFSEEKKLNTIADNVYKMSLSGMEDIKSMEDIVNRDRVNNKVQIEITSDPWQIVVRSYVPIYTPGLNLILSNPHKVEVKLDIATETD